MLNDLGNHTVKILNDFTFRLTQCNLIGNLKDVPYCFAALTINSSYGQPHLIHCG
ncbi:hypothetical protein D3C80_1534540 [compost metagenome]